MNHLNKCRIECTVVSLSNCAQILTKNNNKNRRTTHATHINSSAENSAASLLLLNLLSAQAQELHFLLINDAADVAAAGAASAGVVNCLLFPTQLSSATQPLNSRT